MLVWASVDTVAWQGQLHLWVVRSMIDHDSLWEFPSSVPASQPTHYLWFVSFFLSLLAHLSLPSWLRFSSFVPAPGTVCRITFLCAHCPFADTINMPFTLSWITNKNVKWVRTWHCTFAICRLLTFVTTISMWPFKAEEIRPYVHSSQNLTPSNLTFGICRDKHPH